MKVKIYFCYLLLTISFLFLPAQSQANILLWNKLGNAEEILHSEIGPNGYISGDLSYSPVKFGNGVTNNNTSSYIGFPNSSFNGNRGTIEFWFKTDFNVINGHASGGSAMQKWWLRQQGLYHGGTGGMSIFFDDAGHENIFHVWFFTKNSTFKIARIDAPNISWAKNTIHHMGIVFDRATFDGENTIALYLDGVLKTTTNTSWDEYTNGTNDLWLTNMPAYPQYGGWTKSYSYIDNIKIYDNIKTDFSDRFQEEANTVPEPMTIFMFGIGIIGMYYAIKKYRLIISV